MKITAFDELYSQNLAGGVTYIGGSSGSNSGFAGGDVVGDSGDLSVVGLRQRVSLSSNLTGGIGDVLTIIATNPRTAQFATPSNTSSGSNASLRTTGGADAVTSIGTASTDKVLMIGGANYFTITLAASISIGFTGWATSGSLSEIGVRVTEDGTGGWTPAFTGVTWVGGSTPAHTTAASSSTEYVFWSSDGGSTIVGGQVGAGGGSVSYATPSIALGSSAAAGAATTVIRSDSTIAAFDATVPVTQAFSDVAATGSAAFAARRDHVHGMPDTPASSGGHTHVADEIHLSDGSTTTYTLDGYYEPGSVMAFNRTTIALLLVTEVLPDQATVSAAGASGDQLMFTYAATLV